MAVAVIVCAVALSDLGRVKSSKSVQLMVDMNYFAADRSRGLGVG